MVSAYKNLNIIRKQNGIANKEHDRSERPAKFPND